MPEIYRGYELNVPKDKKWGQRENAFHKKLIDNVIDGTIGPQGPRGYQGYRGYQGSSTGAQGPRGYQGSRGYKCDTWKAVVFTHYYTNGKIKSVRSPLSNKCIQTDSYYDSLGNLMGLTKYKNAVLVSNTCTDGRFGNESLNCLN